MYALYLCLVYKCMHCVQAVCTNVCAARLHIMLETSVSPPAVRTLEAFTSSAATTTSRPSLRQKCTAPVSTLPGASTVLKVRVTVVKTMSQIRTGFEALENCIYGKCWSIYCRYLLQIVKFSEMIPLLISRVTSFQKHISILAMIYILFM